MQRSSALTPGPPQLLARSRFQWSKDPSVTALKRLPVPPQAAIYEPALLLDSFGQAQGALHVHSALVRYLSDWFHFPTLQTWNFEEPAKILVIDEVHIPTLLANRPDFLDIPSTQSIIILAANPSREAILAQDIQSGRVEVLCKPFGPYKLARAICRALEKAALAVHPVAQTKYVEIQAPTRPISAMLPSPQLSPPNKGNTCRNVWGSSPLKDSNNPQPSPRVVTKIRSGSFVNDIEAGPDGGFPFPAPTFDDASPKSQETLELPSIDLGPHVGQRDRIRPPILHSFIPTRSASAPLGQQIRPAFESIKSEPTNRGDLPTTLSELPTSISSAVLSGSPCCPPPSTDKPSSRKPRLLLVDDNKINLQMLHTLVRKKGYDNTLVHLAADGAEAFDIFKSQTHKSAAPDIVFMDVSL
jgi:CheY-like chemotaxis protein